MSTINILHELLAEKANVALLTYSLPVCSTLEGEKKKEFLTLMYKQIVEAYNPGVKKQPVLLSLRVSSDTFSS